MTISSKEIILDYREYEESFRGFQGFNIEKRLKFTSSFYGKIILKIKVYLFLFFSPKSGAKLPKNIFQGFRYKGLIELFEKDDYSVIIGISNIFQALKNKHRFIWSGGGIVGAFELALHLGNYKYLDKVINRLNLWNDGNSKVFLFLYEDTQPLGLVLSKVFNKSENIATICIAHGYFTKTTRSKQLDNYWEGNNCNFNFVWDLSQSQFFDMEKTSVISLGIPYQYSLIDKVDKKNVLFIGHSSPETNLSEFILSYAHFGFIYKILKENNFTVKFKPHPDDKTSYAKTFFGDDIATDLFEEINKGPIVIGFVSSVLYEARALGSHTIGLDMNLFNLERSFDTDKSFKSSDYLSIPGYLNSLKIDNNKRIQPKSLSKRFYNAMANIENK
jgi:hypothetical protein